MSPSARDILQLNIRHYRKLLLQDDLDPKTRQTIEGLLRREESTLASGDQQSGRPAIGPTGRLRQLGPEDG